MLEDRTPEGEGLAPQEAPEDGGTAFNPLFVIVGGVVAAVSGVIPEPPAAFSPLAITQSIE